MAPLRFARLPPTDVRLNHDQTCRPTQVAGRTLADASHNNPAFPHMAILAVRDLALIIQTSQSSLKCPPSLKQDNDRRLGLLRCLSSYDIMRHLMCRYIMYNSIPPLHITRILPVENTRAVADGGTRRVPCVCYFAGQAPLFQRTLTTTFGTHARYMSPSLRPYCPYFPVRPRASNFRPRSLLREDCAPVA
jgi:hypothetical protein